MATGDTLIIFTPNCGEPTPTLNFATPDKVNNHLVWDFKPYDIVASALYFSGIMPQHYSDGTIKVYLHYTMSSAVEDVIRLGVNFATVIAGVSSGGIFGIEVNTGDVTVPGTAGILDVTSTTHVAGERDDVAAGNGFRLRVRRQNPSGTDATGDLELWRIELREA